MVERLVYTELVGGSNPSPRTIFRLNEAKRKKPHQTRCPSCSAHGDSCTSPEPPSPDHPKDRFRKTSAAFPSLCGASTQDSLQNPFPLLTIHVAETKPSKPTPSFSLHLCPPVCHLSAFPHRAIRHSSFVIPHSRLTLIHFRASIPLASSLTRTSQVPGSSFGARSSLISTMPFSAA